MDPITAQATFEVYRRAVRSLALERRRMRAHGLYPPEPGTLMEQAVEAQRRMLADYATKAREARAYLEGK